MKPFMHRLRISRALDDSAPLAPGTARELERDPELAAWRERLLSLDERLRREAGARRSRGAKRLTPRVMARVHRERAAADSGTRVEAPSLGWAGAAAALLLLGLVFTVRSTRSAPAPPPEQARVDVAKVTNELLAVWQPVVRLPRTADDSLEAEARNLWSDTSRAALDVARGLPRPLRARLDF